MTAFIYFLKINLNRNSTDLDAIIKLERNVLWGANVLYPILCKMQRSLMKPIMNVKGTLVLLKHHLKKDSGNMLEASNIKSMRTALNL